MKIKNITPLQMMSAICAVNKHYGDNIQFNRFDVHTRSIDFTLRVKSSRGTGAKISSSGRRSVAACWHAHRDFMRELFEISPSAVLTSMHAKYNGLEGFNQSYLATADINVGSQALPVSFAQACGCGC